VLLGRCLLDAQERTSRSGGDTSEKCRFCCKSLFASLNTNFQGRTRGDQTLIWGTTLSSDELTGDFGNGLEATSIGDCGLFVLSRKISRSAFWDFCNKICHEQTHETQQFAASFDHLVDARVASPAGREA
jgi:hypothetical protein